ncbi:MAG: terminase small subunit [Patescibacteria group bacterium]|jgi:phage terminase small subunit
MNQINKPKIVDKQIIFAEQYIISNRNGTIAYKAVYGQELDDNTAAVNASRLLRNAKIREYLKERFAVLELDANYVLAKLKQLAEEAKSDSTKLQAIIAIGKSLGMFNDNQTIDPASEYAARNAYVNEYFKNTFLKHGDSDQKQLSQY